MPFGQEAMYDVKVFRETGINLSVEHFRMSNRTFERAQAGYLLSQGWICDKIHERIVDELGRDPGIIRYEDLTFMRRCVVPRGAKRPPSMKAAPPHKRSRTLSLISRR